jgi:hypothetical protein
MYLNLDHRIGLSVLKKALHMFFLMTAMKTTV